MGSYLLKATEAELDAWKLRARTEGYSLAAWIREACNAKLEPPEAVGRSLTAGQREAGPLFPEAHSEAAQPPLVESTVYDQDVSALEVLKEAADAEFPTKPSECARAWSHRKGTYCRNCGFV